MTASRDSGPAFPTAKGLIVSMEGVCYSICPLYNVQEIVLERITTVE